MNNDELSSSTETEVTPESRMSRRQFTAALGMSSALAVGLASAPAAKADAPSSPLGGSANSFEIDSKHVGARFAITVALPLTYHLHKEKCAIIYATDGNLLGHVTTPSMNALMGHESVTPVRPYIQVNIGYVPAEAPLAIALRNRDLVPPGEPYPAVMDAYLRKHLRIDEGLTPESVLEIFHHHLANSHSDNFLAFIEEELHPEILKRYRVDGEDVGLFGFSYGGLFTLYAYSSGSSLIKKYGATSPGILVEDSAIFEHYKKYQTNNGEKQRDAHVHITVSDFEMLGPVALYRKLGIHTMRYIDLMRDQPVPGVRLTTEIIPGEDHGNGCIQAYKSFMRTCFPSV